uniref:UBR-type domain-containing protein n=1 Tax=Ascaris lumbricoides TaxID=6252 RepID=A0A0M3HTT2_ASCLU
MGLQLTNDGDWPPGELVSLLDYVIHNASSMSEASVALCAHRLCINFAKFPNSEMLRVTEACHSLMRQLADLAKSGRFDRSHLADVLSCLLNATPLPFSYLSSLTLNTENQITIEVPLDAQELTQGTTLSVKEILQVTEVFFTRYFSLEQVVKSVVPDAAHELAQECIVSFQKTGIPSSANAVILQPSTIGLCQEGLASLDKLLNQELRASLAAVNDFLGGLLMATTATAVREHPDITDENLMNLAAMIISVHKNMLKATPSYEDLRGLHASTFQLFFKCIETLIQSGKTDLAYLLANYFLGIVPKLLTTIVDPPMAEFFDLLWSLAVCSLQDSQELSDEGNIKTSVSADSSDDPTSGIGDWLANILSDVPAMIDQQEAALNARSASLFVVSSLTLIDMCERCLYIMEQCTSKSNVWSQHAQRSFRTICALCANETTRSSSTNVVNILLKLFAEAILSEAVDYEFKNSVVHEMLHFGESGGSITSNSFCLNVAAEGALLGHQNADILAEVIQLIATTAQLSAPQSIHQWLFKCLCEAWSAADLCSGMRKVVELLHNALKSGDEKHSYIRKKTLAQMAYVVLIGGRGWDKPRKSLEEFRKYVNDVFDINTLPDWSTILLTRKRIKYAAWSEVHLALIEWIFAAKWDDGQLPVHAILPAPTSFFHNVIEGRASIVELHHFIRIRPLLIDDKYADFIKAFNDDDPAFDILKLRDIGILCSAGARILNATTADDLKHFSPVRYDTLLSLMNMLKSEECSDEILKAIVSFCSRIRNFSLSEMCGKANIKRSLRACCAAVSLANSPLLNTIVPSARGDLQSCLNDVLLKAVTEWAHVAHPELRPAFSSAATLDVLSTSFSSPNTACSFAQLPAKEIFAAVNSTYDNAIRFILHHIAMRDNKNAKMYIDWKFSDTESYLDWIISVQCSQLSSTAAGELCATIVKAIEPAEVITQGQLLHNVRSLLDAVLVDQSSLEMNLLSGAWIFCSVLNDMVSVTNADAVPWDKLPTDIFANLLDRIIQEPDLCRQSVPLIGLLSRITSCNNAALSSIFLEPLESRLQLLTQWVTASEMRLETFLQLRPLLEHLSANHKNGRMDLLPDGMLEALLGSSLYQQLVGNCPLLMRRSDRWNYATLSARRQPGYRESISTKTKEGQASRLTDESDLFKDVLVTLISIGGPRIHEKLVDKCNQLFAQIIWNVREADRRVLEGNAGDSPSALVHSFVMMRDILEYIGALSEAVSPFPASVKDIDERSFNVMPENFFKKQTSTPKAPGERPLCTYRTTEKQFILQHWYNCYTCGMIDGEGVCSVCAVNCHRGHDISYSKQGSFFCDCGAKGCPALTMTVFPLTPTESDSVTVVSTTPQSTQQPTQTSESFHDITVNMEDRSRIQQLLRSFLNMLAVYRPHIGSIMRAILVGCSTRSLSKHAERIAHTNAELSQPLTVELNRPLMKHWITSQKVVCDKKLEGNRSGQNLLGVLKVENIQMLATVQENSRITLLSTHALFCASDSATDIDLPRIEVEPVGFKVISLSCMRDLLVACGNHQFIMMRFKANGDVEDKRTVDIKPSVLKGSIVKAEWVETDEGPMVAVASESFVRIYDVSDPSDDAKLEFVLPLGNVVDIAFGARKLGGIEIFVLSSAGHIYMEELEKADNNSYYMMNAVSLPFNNNAVSMHYSNDSRFLFVSQNGYFNCLEGTCVARFNENDELDEVQNIEVDHAMSQWSECAGVVSAVVQPPAANVLFFFYFCGGTVYVQSLAMPSIAQANCMLLEAGNASHLAIQIVDNQTLQILKSDWHYEPDLWVKDVECSVVESEPHTIEIKEEKQQEEDLVTVFESCNRLEKVRFSSKALQLSYDADELTKRLNSPGMGAVCLKKRQFDIVVTNMDWNMVICALRIEIGGSRSPSSVSVFGKTRYLHTDRPRIFDIPLTRKQSLECGNEVVLTFTNESFPSHLGSIKVYGKTKREFGFPIATYRLEQTLTLPEQTLSTFMSTCARLCAAEGNAEKFEWLVSFASLFAAPGFHHNRLRVKSLELLLVLSPELDVFFDVKDSALFNEMVLHGQNGTLQLSLLNAFAAHAKQVLLKRPLSFHRRMKKCFGGVLKFIDLLSQGFQWKDGDQEPLLDCFLLTSCMYMAAAHAATDELISRIISVVFSEDVLFAHRCKEILLARIAQYSFANVNDNSAIFDGRSSSPLLEASTQPSNSTESAGDSQKSAPADDLFTPSVASELRGGFGKDEARPLTVRCGDIPPAAEKFCVATEWLMNLLESVLEHLNSCNYDGKRCVAAAQIIVQLIGHHTSDQLQPLVDFFARAVDFTWTHLTRSVQNERQEVFIRLAIAILTFFSSAVSESSVVTWWQEFSFLPSFENTFVLSEDPVSSIGSPFENTAMDVSVNGEEAEEDFDNDNGQRNEGAGDMGLAPDEVIPPEPNSEIDLSTSMLRFPPLSGLAHSFASKLIECGAMDYCFTMLNLLLVQHGNGDEERKSSESVLPAIPRQLHPDLSPLFDENFVSRLNADDLFASYSALLSESALKLAYLLKKIVFECEVNREDWDNLLCEYISNGSQKNVRLARGLLMLFCGGDKAKFREVRDEQSILKVLRYLKTQFENRTAFQYEQLSTIVQSLQMVWLLMSQRVSVWQKICMRELSWLLELACTIPDVASGSVLSVIILAVRPNQNSVDDSMCCDIANSLLANKRFFTLLCRLINRFLMNESEEYRFVMHTLLRSTLQLASRRNQMELMRHLLDVVWPQAQQVGPRAAQLVDIVASYLPRFSTTDELLDMYANVTYIMETALEELEAQSRSVLFARLKKIVDVLNPCTPNMALTNGTACLTCSALDMRMDVVKLSAIKLDSRFTTSAQMIKLMGHFEVLRVSMRLSDIKRSKMIKRVRLYYCNRELESAVDLKNRSDLWEKAADVEVNQGETEIEINLAIPIITCNIVLEMADFYETSSAGVSGATELVHCPRCTTAVAPNPGICSNCGENVFQCVKCRAINYDEKEPFLCNSCGFCKYARLESTLFARPVPSVQPIENDEDRIAAMTQTVALLRDIESERCEIAMLVTLMEKESWESEPVMRPNMLLRHISQERFRQFMIEMRFDEGLTLAMLYNKADQMHKNLINQTRRLAALRAEMHRFDVENGDAELIDLPISTGFYTDSLNCFGCQSALFIHCIALLQAVCSDSQVLETLVSDERFFARLVESCAISDMMANSVHLFIQKVAEVSEEATQRMCQLALRNQFPAYLLAKPILDGHLQFWDLKLQCLMRLAVTGNGDREVDLHTLAILQRLCAPTANFESNMVANDVDPLSLRPPPGYDVDTLTEEEQMTTRPILTRPPDPGVVTVQDNTIGAVVPAFASTEDRMESQRTATVRTLHVDQNVMNHLLPSSWTRSALKELIVARKPFPFLSWLKGCQFRGCWQEERSDESNLDIWLSKCMFSPVAGIRFITYRLLITLCFHQIGPNLYELGTVTDFALVIQRVLLWLENLSDVKVERREEYFCLLRTLVAVPDIRRVIVSKPIRLIDTIFNLIHKECSIFEDYKRRGVPNNLSMGGSVLQFVELLMCLLNYGGGSCDGLSLLRVYGQKVIEELLGVSACFSVMSEYQTRAISDSSFLVASLILRMATRKPKRIIRTILQYLKRRDLHRLAQTNFLHLLTNIVHPPVKKEESFLIQIEKDPLQEEYLQGRMPGNPYRSTDAGMGPLMRDIKNKICRDCELVALLEDDNGMELLVNQQIISLDLSVAEVYEKLWRKDHPDQPMIIIYRMRGLLGDATEPFVQSLADTSNKESVNDEQLRLAAIFGDLHGLSTVIQLIDDVELTSATKSLLAHMYQLLFYCAKMERNRRQLIKSGAISRLLRVFERVHKAGVKEDMLEAIALQSLQLCNVLLTDVVTSDRRELQSLSGVKFEQMSWLLELSMDPLCNLTAPIWGAVTSLVPNLCLGNAESMDALVAIFRPCCDWEQIDKDRVFREVMTRKLNTLCSITNAIPASTPGAVLKKKLMDAGLIAAACEYLAVNHPPLFNVSVEGPEWKQFLARPALKYVLKLLAGMARTHKPSQEAIAEHTLPILHRLEQISSSEHIGTMAENVMEELKQNEKVAAEIEKVRRETKAKKRQLAMMMRQKQLSKMGMQVSQKGQVKVIPRKIANEPGSSSKSIDVLSECCICREGLDTVDKVMMVYAFASRQDLTTAINGRSFTFATVSQMNLVHLECHSTAIRMAIGRDEWSSAALHNANTKCNVMVPVWSKTVKDADMTNALRRLTNDLEVAVGFGTLTVETVLLDMSQLLDRFVNYRSFSELSQGGGRESNLQFLSVLLLLVLHLRNDVNSEVNSLPGQMPQLTMRISSHLIVNTRSEWIQERVSVISEIHHATPKWDDAKPALLLWAVIDFFHTKLVPDSDLDRVQFLRANVANVSKQCSEFVNKFDNVIAQAQNFEAFCETVGK